ncbi:hypothetical protein TYRP_003231 [Tyrophagus putrescentiae]|nr:hypothetical protein TYRP_009523 [Tyrophagus putrescentiae]KAH9396931.1 hypothetical protein TYRP_003231 [Tyrophagus putrescentiae]
MSLKPPSSRSGRGVFFWAKTAEANKSRAINRRELIGVVRRRIDDHLTEEVPAGAAVDAFFASKAALFQTVPLCEREVDVVVGAPDHLRLGRVDRADGEEAEVGQLRLEALNFVTSTSSCSSLFDGFDQMVASQSSRLFSPQELTSSAAVNCRSQSVSISSKWAW